MPFKSDAQRRAAFASMNADKPHKNMSRQRQNAAFANMSAHEFKGLRTKSQEYVLDERKAVKEYKTFKKELSDAGLPQRMVDNVDTASHDEHRHMEYMIDIREKLDEHKEQKQFKKGDSVIFKNQHGNDRKGTIESVVKTTNGVFEYRINPSGKQDDIFWVDNRNIRGDIT